MTDASRAGNTEPGTHKANLIKAGVDLSVKPEHIGAEKQGRALNGAGLVGAGLATICCFTPLLVVVLPAVGLGGWLAGVDWVLLPLLLVSLGAITLRLVRRREQTDARCGT